MDVFFVEAVVRELRQKVRGARIDKVHQPGSETIVLRLWNGRESLRLLISVDPRRPRLHLTTVSLPNPYQPPRFCQLLRSRLSAIVDLQQVEGDRVVRFQCRKKEGGVTDLIVELMGSQADMVLMEKEGRIIDSLRRSASEGREQMPGQEYRSPVSRRLHPLTADLPEMPPEAQNPHFFSDWLLKTVAPMSPLVARDLAEGVAQGLTPETALGQFRDRWASGAFSPRIVWLEGRPQLSPFELLSLRPEQEEVFDTPSEAAEAFYALTAEKTVSGEKEDLRKLVARAVKRLRKRLVKIGKDREAVQGVDRQRHLGELLLSNLHRVQKGMREITVDDYYESPPVPVTIPLDPRLSPPENAEALFRGYKKGRRGEEHIDRRLEESRQELDWMEGLEQALEEAESPEELRSVRVEMEEAGLLRPGRPTPGVRREPSPKEMLRQASTPGGFSIFWGKNGRTNDYVSRTLTEREDLWFHAHNLPGAHLVLRRGNWKGPFPEEDLLYAAAVAAGYSKGRSDSKVEVKVAEGKAVKKPKGARPGLVTVGEYRTVLVRPLRLEEKESRQGLPQ